MVTVIELDGFHLLKDHKELLDTLNSRYTNILDDIFVSILRNISTPYELIREIKALAGPDEYGSPDCTEDVLRFCQCLLDQIKQYAPLLVGRLVGKSIVYVRCLSIFNLTLEIDIEC